MEEKPRATATAEPELSDEQKAADAKLAQQQADAEERYAYNKAQYEKSIEGQELPPSVQAEQKAAAKSAAKAK